MSLEDLNQKIYDPNSDLQNRTHEESPFTPTLEPKNNSGDFKEEKDWGEIKKGMSEGTKKALKTGAFIFGGIMVAAGLIIAAVMISRSAFSENNVSLSIEGPNIANSNEATEYEIIYKNDNRVDLKNAAVILNYSENFQPEVSATVKSINPNNSRIAIGDIKAHSTETITLKGKFFAPQDYVVYVNAVLNYTPSNFASQFQYKTQIGVSVKSSPLILNITAPLEVANGDQIEYVINYRNQSSHAFADLRLKVEYADGFSFKSSQPEPSDSSGTWYLGTINPNSQGKLNIQGTIQGSESEMKTIKVSLISNSENGVAIFNAGEKSTKISASPLIITQTVDGTTGNNVNPGAILNYTLTYRNSGNTALRNNIVIINIDSPVLDFSKLELQSGAYDAGKKTITWKSADVSDLANLDPGKQGSVRFSIPVLDRIPVANENDKNFTVNTIANMQSADLLSSNGSPKIVSSNSLNLKLNSRVIVETLGFYTDTVLPNSGPIPPRVGQTTTYTIHWKITNVSNDISDAQLVSAIPSGVSWMGKSGSDRETIHFNNQTNQITWDLGSVKSGTGVLTPPREIYFQLSITPQVNQVNKEITLLNASTFTAKDVFTGSDIKVNSAPKTNNLTEDPSINSQYRVAP